ncbi:MAG TPA: sugar phosphate nucleotidyltransferase [Bacteroidales bacterium]|nr:sugar phosphate nucleotidyltransferase [Bacteroidales bacterium]
MKIIIPMAGIGKRMRPHTLSVPKPLISLAGKSIVQRLVESISLSLPARPEEIAFIVGDFGEAVEKQLLDIAQQAGATGRIYYQEEALGTAHAIHCAAPSLEGPVVVAFADTLFKADFLLRDEEDAVIWTSHVEDPSAFGVVVTGPEGRISAFVEKPREFISDQAIIGIYYFRDGAALERRLKSLIERGMHRNGEFQLTDTLQEMLEEGVSFSTAAVDEWLDCGNKDATVQTHQRLLEHEKSPDLISPLARIGQSLVIPPCYIAPGAEISDSVIGPYVSIGENTRVEHSIITNSVIQSDTRISDANLDNSMIGSQVVFEGSVNEVSLGDYSIIN